MERYCRTSSITRAALMRARYLRGPTSTRSSEKRRAILHSIRQPQQSKYG